MSLTTYGKTFGLKKLLGESVPSRSANYLGLGFGSDATGILSEVSATGYARVSVPPVDWLVSDATLSNAQPVYVSTTSASFGSPTSWGIFDASTGGNCLFSGVIDPTQEIAADQQIYFPIGELNLTLDPIAGGSGLSEYWRALSLSDLVGKTDTAAPSLFVGFSSSTDLETAITGETFSGGYAREAFGAAEAVVIDSGKATTSNSTDISFTVSGAWGTNLVRMFIASHATETTADRLLFVGSIASISPESGDLVEVKANDYTLTLE